MFVYIKHGDGEQFLTNTNCPVILLLQFIRNKLGLLESDLVDLCDERGVLKLLFLSQQPQESASRLLPSRCTFTVCSINRQSDGVYTSITPKVANPDPTLLEALQTQTDNLERARLKQLRSLEDKRNTGETPTQLQPTPQAKGKGKIVHMDTPDEEPQRRVGGRRNKH